ncbi:DUF2279 domain-containing protein [Hymenobacter artigasi]|uniref:Uncharacterized protein YfiM (DUF2279 family) n=1 Tax=Hymenobacter artigasi TaxID=2719616 RepID=A0ABX1HP98_9BACT|nr:DUF2279 domain-containing protein [Hymenobacter artigasi]NKI90947.1 uncharacterized protein YfiM (DUF2279 family) [Hymenobacter artigasi]
MSFRTIRLIACLGSTAVILGHAPVAAQALPPFPAPPDPTSHPDGINSGRLVGVVVGTTVLYALSTYLLGKTWYTRRVPFHFFNDNNEWLQMDKVGHATTAYAISRGEYELFRWSGVPDRTAALTGGAIALLFQSTIEVFDGHSQGWGFSKGDMAANAAGVALFVGQQVGLGQQPLSLRYGFRSSIYPQYRPELLGRRRFAQLLKDYNGQQYWLSVNVASVLPVGPSFPRWLNLDLGYSGSGMTGGSANPPLYGADGRPLVFRRVRQFYLAPDLDLARLVPVGSTGHMLLGTTQFLKLPTPSLEFNPRDGWRWHPVRAAAD